jgi:hypothetical protein
VFKADAENEAVKVSEVLILELEEAPEGRGVERLWVTDVKAYLDPAAVQTKGRTLMEKGKS